MLIYRDIYTQSVDGDTTSEGSVCIRPGCDLDELVNPEELTKYISTYAHIVINILLNVH